MKDKKGTLPLVANMIIGLVILGAGTMFVTSDIGRPYFNSLSELMFPKLTPGCDTNSVDSINGLAYALNCVGMHHAGVDVTEICPEQNESGSKIVICHGEDENYQCEVQGFELTRSPDYDESDPEGWITGMGDPNCLVYYEAFPEEEAADWKVRVQEFSWGGMLLGGTLNMIPGMKNPVKATYNGLKLSAKGLIKVVKEPFWIPKMLSQVPGAVIRTPGVIYKASKATFQKAVLERRLLLQGVKRANGALNYVLHGKTILDDPISTQLTKAMIEESNEYILKNSKFVGKEFENALIIRLETESGGLITEAEAKSIARNYRSSLEYIIEGSKGNTLTKLQRLRHLNIYDDFMQAGLHSGGWTEKMMKDEIEKSIKIYNKLPASQKNNILLSAKRLSEFYITPKTLKSAPFQLWAVDTVGQLNITESFLNEDNAEAVSAFTSCGVMLGASTGTLACAFVTSVGVMAAYIDNDNEKYNPVGINAIGYKTNYYDVQIEYLENIINYYYIALKRDDHQRETRFFLASPCKTEKVVVKHEIIECYIKECKNDVICCNKTINPEIGSTTTGVQKELMWLPEDSCVGFPENYNAYDAPNSGTMQNSYIFNKPKGQKVALYTDITTNLDGKIELPAGTVAIATFDTTGYDIVDMADEIVSDSFCLTEDKPLNFGNCQGAFYETEPDDYSTKEYYPINYPYITTIDQYEGTGIEYTPGNNLEWYSTVEIKSSEYSYNDLTGRNIEGDDYYIQFQSATEHNDEVQNLGSSSIFIPKLYMDAYGMGIKQCETNPKHMENLWKTKTKTTINALTVDVEFDESFDGNNYCYAGKDFWASTLKGGAMLVTVGVAIVADIVLVGTGVGTMGIPAVNFVTGAAYEGFVYLVDKSNAWPHR